MINLSHRIRRLILVAIGISINVIMSLLMQRLEFPFYFDTIGTIGVSAVSGMLFPGILTAVATNFICTLFNENAIYFASINAIIAIYTVWFVRRRSFKKIGRTILFIVTLSLFAGLVSSPIQWGLFKQHHSLFLEETLQSFSGAMKLSPFASFCLINILLNILDKGFSCVFVFLLLWGIPRRIVSDFEKGVWKQRPLMASEIRVIKKWKSNIKISLRTRTTLIMLTSSVLLVFIIGWIGTRLYFDSMKADRTKSAEKSLKFASEMIEPFKVNDFIKNGNNAADYNETAAILKKIYDSSTDLNYLYVFRVEKDGCRFIFDAGHRGSGLPTLYPGHLVPFYSLPFADEFESHVPALLEGKEIKPIEKCSFLSWNLAMFQPVLDRGGRCVCYVGVNVFIEHSFDSILVFLTKVFLTVAGFFILILAYELWTSGVYISYPIISMASCIDSFSKAGEDQEKLDENVKAIRSLDISTGDEVEKLYESICRLIANQAEQMRNIRRLSESTAKMQDGLIITMADMVESRDSDTGAHVQKTAAYVQIIVEGLKKKGYYLQKITPKFMSDVVRSAPLHDVGKINIPDGVLNKPGKLTDEEYAIMKTHTSVGKKILENAISTIQGENYLKEARNMAAYHHERWDGKGYPEGLHGEVIPLSARIMAVADVFDALASPRVYKPAFPLEKALSILKEGAGTQFDAKCVEVFIDALPEVKEVLRKYNPSLVEEEA